MTTEQPDLYAVLGVAPSATQAEISHAYRALLRHHHPDTRVTADRSQSALSDSALREVIAAYAVLRDPSRRAEYDRQATRPTRPARQRLQPAQTRARTNDQPPIVAGPVRWLRRDIGP
jgi:DnaJ-class molecular chaperone